MPLDEAPDALFGLLGDDRAHIGLLVHIGSDAQALDHRRQLVDEAVCGFLADRDGDRDRHAALAGRAVAGADQRIGGLVEIGIRHDDHMVLGAAEALGALAVHRRSAIDVAGDRGRADEGDGGDIRMRQDSVDRALVAIDNVEDTRRQPGLDHQFGKADRYGRIALGGFRMKALPQAIAGANIHIGIMAGKLNGVIPAPMPTGWRIEYMSMPGPAPSVNSLF